MIPACLSLPGVKRTTSKPNWPVLGLVVLLHLVPVLLAIAKRPEAEPVPLPMAAYFVVSPGTGNTAGVGKSPGKATLADTLRAAGVSASSRSSARYQQNNQVHSKGRDKSSATGRKATSATAADAVHSDASGDKHGNTSPRSDNNAASRTSAGGHSQASGSGEHGSSDAFGPSGSGFSAPSAAGNGFTNPKPVYPPASRRLGEAGTVWLSVFVAANGSVREVRIKKSSGYTRLDDAACKAVGQWRYRPARRNGQPVDIWHSQAVHFSLTD